MSQLDDSRTRVIEWRRDPVLFARDLFGFECDPWQKKYFRAFADTDPMYQRIALQACAGPGKSAALAISGWNFMTCYGDANEHPKGAATAVNGDNLRDNLWAEMGKWYDRSPFLQSVFGMTSERIFCRDHQKDWFFSARTFSKNANPDEQGRTLSGLHAKFVLVLIDESAEIPVAVLKTAEQALGNCWWGKICQAGNPTSQKGMLYAAASTFSKLWHLISITADPDDPDRSTRIDPVWARQQIEHHGRDDAWVMAYILGKFPPGDINSLLSPDEVHAAMKRTIDPAEYAHVQKRIGVDVAREGDDRTVLFPRHGLVAFRPVVMRGAKGHEVAARLMVAKAKFGSEVEFIDNTGGFGSSVIDSLIQAEQSPMEVNFSGKAEDPRYFNTRSEMWFRMAEWVKRGGVLPNIPELIAELTVPTYAFQKGTFQLEEKKLIKKRLKRSPDLADGLALTFYMKDIPAASYMPGNENRGQPENFDYNPLTRKSG